MLVACAAPLTRLHPLPCPARSAIGLSAAYIFSKSVQLEKRHAQPTRPIPSQRWAAASFPKQQQQQQQ